MLSKLQIPLVELPPKSFSKSQKQLDLFCLKETQLRSRIV